MNGRIWLGQCISGRVCKGGVKMYRKSGGYQNFWYDGERVLAWVKWKGMFVVVKMEWCGRGTSGGEDQREGDWMSVVKWREQRRRHLAEPDGEDGLGSLWAVLRAPTGLRGAGEPGCGN